MNNAIYITEAAMHRIPLIELARFLGQYGLTIVQTDRGREVREYVQPVDHEREAS